MKTSVIMKWKCTGDACLLIAFEGVWWSDGAQKIGYVLINIFLVHRNVIDSGLLCTGVGLLSPTYRTIIKSKKLINNGWGYKSKSCGETILICHICLLCCSYLCVCEWIGMRWRWRWVLMCVYMYRWNQPQPK